MAKKCLFVKMSLKKTLVTLDDSRWMVLYTRNLEGSWWSSVNDIAYEKLVGTVSENLS